MHRGEQKVKSGMSRGRGLVQLGHRSRGESLEGLVIENSWNAQFLGID